MTDTPSSRSMEQARSLARDLIPRGCSFEQDETYTTIDVPAGALVIFHKTLALALDAARAEERERVIAEFAGDLVSQFAAVRAEERERCARIADAVAAERIELRNQTEPGIDCMLQSAKAANAQFIASVIRASEIIGESEERTTQ